MTLDSPLADAIASLELPHPVTLVVDVDEVIVQFFRPLVTFLEAENFRLDLVSYGLTGNIKYAGTDRAAPKEVVAGLIQAFFDARIGDLPLVDGAAETLNRLAEAANVVLLTNAPHRHRATRRDSLAASGLSLPLLTNDGPKGPAVAALTARAPGPLVFIDAAPSHRVSVRDRVPSAHLIHFIADPHLLALAPDISGTKLKTGDWREVEAWVATEVHPPR